MVQVTRSKDLVRQSNYDHVNTLFENLKTSTKFCLIVPESMNAIYPVKVKRGSPVFLSEVVEKNTIEDNNEVEHTAQQLTSV